MTKKKKFKKASILVFLLLLISYISSCYFVKSIFYYNSSKSFMSYIVYLIIILTSLFIVLFSYKGLKAIKINKTKNYIKYFILLILFIAIELVISFNINRISNSLSKITNKEKGYSTSLITLRDSDLDKNNLDDKTIGIINDENNIEGHTLAYKAIDELKIDEEYLAKYDDFIEMLDALYNEEIDAMFVSSSYVGLIRPERNLHW